MKKCWLTGLLIVLSLSRAQADEAIDAPTANDFITLFEALSGPHPGARKAHAKGVCVSGNFMPENNKYSDSALFSRSSEVLMRFSLGGGNPMASDNSGGPRGAAVRFLMEDGSLHNIAGLTVPLFAGSTPRDFYRLLELSLPDENGVVDREALQNYVASVPGIVARNEWSATHNPPISYSRSNYYGVHTFFFNKGETSQKFRWTLVPLEGEQLLADGQMLAKNEYYDDLVAELSEGSIKFRWEASLGLDEDSDIDPGQLWPADRRIITLGTITITALAEDACDAFTFDPTLVAPGFSISDDPVLRMRSPAYAISFAKRLTNQ